MEQNKSELRFCQVSHKAISLFSLYINDISKDTSSEIRLFTDDHVCYHEIKDIDGILKLQKIIGCLGCWARVWSMGFQLVKCNMM